MKKSFKIRRFKVGDKFYGWYDNLYHIVSFFPDKDVNLICYKTWVKHKARWEYYTKPFITFLYEMGLWQELSKEDRKKLIEINFEGRWLK